MTRRELLKALTALSVLYATGCDAAGKPKADAAIDPQNDWKGFIPAGAKLPTPAEPLKLGKDQWRERLTPIQFDVLRDEGTERPGSSPLNAEKRAGVYLCAGCDLPVFTSEMKFESGTGWPSFYTSIPGAFATSTDFKLIVPRTEYHCARCGGHHGHIFDDGPPPTGQRWCNNGVALKFLPKNANT